MENTGIITRVPPNNLEAERALLGSLLLNSNVLGEISSSIRSEDFYHYQHQLIYQSIYDFNVENPGVTVDLLTLTEYLKQKGILEKCGGYSYVAQLTSSVPSASNAQYYCEIVKNLSLRRNVITVSDRYTSKAFDEAQDIHETIDQMEHSIDELSTSSSTGENYFSLHERLSQVIQTIIDRTKSSDTLGISTGFTDLDDFLGGGFKKQEYVIIGARPSIGKTAFALSLAANMAFNEKKPVKVGFLSLEMPAAALIERLVAARSRIDFSLMRKGTLKSTDTNRILEACETIYTSKFFIQDTPNMSLIEVRSQARKMKREQDIDILFIDYIGLISTAMDAKIPRHEQVSYISRTLKQLCRELDLPIVCLCQVGRDTEGQEPKLNSLRESGSIEQDADVVIFLHRDREKQDTVVPTDVIIAKNRNGKTGKLSLGFYSSLVCFENLANDNGTSYRGERNQRNT